MRTSIVIAGLILLCAAVTAARLMQQPRAVSIPQASDALVQQADAAPTRDATSGPHDSSVSRADARRLDASPQVTTQHRQAHVHHHEPAEVAITDTAQAAHATASLRPVQATAPHAPAACPAGCDHHHGDDHSEMIGGPDFELADLPPSKLTDSIAALTPEAQRTARDWLRRMPVPPSALDHMRAGHTGSLCYVCALFDDDTSQDPPMAAGAGSNPTAPIYHSKEGATQVLYIDFDGGSYSNTAWSGGSTVYEPRPFSIDNDYTSFSAEEEARIYAIWQRVAEDFAPFNIDVTTEEPASYTNKTGHVFVTPTTDANGRDLPHDGYDGVAWVGVFGWSNYATDYNISFVRAFTGSDRIQRMALAVSHEFGHNLALNHQEGDGSAYYDGHGSGDTEWCPIMGSSYTAHVDTWTTKDAYATQSYGQDDLKQMKAVLGYRVDDHGDSAADSSDVSYASATAFTASGVIEQTDEIDAFNFAAGAGAITITATTLDTGYGQGGGNLDVRLELYAESDESTLLAFADPTDSLNATLSYTAGAADVFLVKVVPSSWGDPYDTDGSTRTGWITYGSLGQYDLAGSCVAYGAPEFELRGNDIVVQNGDGTPDAEDQTHFGVVDAPSTVDHDFIIHNRGSETLTISSITVTDTGSVVGDQFSVLTNPGASIAAFSSATLTIRYDAAAGTETATLAITTDDGDESSWSCLLQGGGITEMTYSDTVFTEDSDDDGSIDDTTLITVDLVGDTFTGAVGDDLIADGKVTVTNLPAGLSLTATLTSSVQLELEMGDNATDHDSFDSISNLQLTFLDTAFSNNDAASHTNYDRSDLQVNFAGLRVTTSLDSGDDATIGASGADDRSDGGGLSLREALAHASAGDEISFDDTVTYITLDGGMLVVDLDLTIEGGDGVTIDAVNVGDTCMAIDDGKGFKDANVVLNNLTIINADNSGGGYYSGGGIDCFENLTMYRCTLEDNTTLFYGGGLAAWGASLTITECTFRNNTAIDSTSESGGFYSYADTTTVTSCLFDGNSAYRSGAFSQNSLGEAFMDQCTFINNTSTNSGAVYYSQADVTFRNCTITGNTAVSSGAIRINSSGASVTLISTIIAGNSPKDVSCAGTATFTDCLYDTTNLAVSGTLNTSGGYDLNGASPLIGDLADNGGSVYTCALLAGSNAIDAGSNPASLTTDIRGDGFDRVVGGGIDIGAHENQQPVLDAQTAYEITMSEDGSPTAWSPPALAVDDPELSAAAEVVWSISSAPTNGSASFSDSNDPSTLVYTPDADWYGTDSFVVAVTDGNIAAGADCTITVIVEQVFSRTITIDVQDDAGTIDGTAAIDSGDPTALPASFTEQEETEDHTVDFVSGSSG